MGIVTKILTGKTKTVASTRYDDRRQHDIRIPNAVDLNAVNRAAGGSGSEHW